jgi:DNA/RNA endonuclease YhcR with UshA esterase domain
MKIWLAVIAILAFALLFAPALAAQKPEPVASVPKYDPATEAVYKGTVELVKDHECPVSGGMGSHLILKLSDGNTIEVHLATTKFVQLYELVFNKGEQVEVTGSKVKFAGVDTIFAREVKRGNDTFVFRDKEGNPAW